MIEWQPIDVLTCLEVEPAVGEDALSYSYTFQRDGHNVTLDIWPYDTDVKITIGVVGRTELLVDLHMQGCEAIRYIREGAAEQLFFKSHDQRSEYRPNIAQGWRLLIQPRLSVRLGGPGAG